MVGFRGSFEFLSDVAARDAGIVGGKRHGHTKLQVHRKRMMVAGDVENHVIAGEANFDENIFASHMRKRASGSDFCITPTP